MQHRDTRPAAPVPADSERSEPAAGAGAAEPLGVASAATATARPAGAPPCFTAPANRTAHVLRAGLDSLYLSAKGQIFESIGTRLEDLKQRAQSDAESIQTTAQLPFGQHLFCVSDRGRRRFAYVLEDNWFSIALSRRGNVSMPMAHVQISSQALTDRGPIACESALRKILTGMGQVDGPLSVSRADLFADFTTTTDLSALSPEAWICRGRKRGIYTEGQQFTGQTFGAGGILSARLYDKTFEITRSKKTYLLDLWRASGWDGSATVWRIEFQIRRAALPPELTASLGVFLESLPATWVYLLNQWLRLSIPNADDDSRERWATHPLWDVLAAIYPSTAPANIRAPLSRTPCDQTLFTNGLGALSSFMAREGITDMGEGFGEYLRQAEQFHAKRSNNQGEGLANYLLRKTKAKGRRFNTLRTNHDGE